MTTKTPLRRPVLLIVDDDVDQLLLFRINAQRSNAYSEVITIDDPSKAVSQLFSGVLRSGMPAPRPDIVVTDLKMPAMNGIDLVKAVQANKATRHIAVVVLTGGVSPRDRAAVLAAGCRAVLQKPYDLQGLIALFASLPQLCGISLPPGKPEADPTVSG